MQRVADDQTHTGKARIQPVDRWLTIFEVVQIDPTPFGTVDAYHWTGRAPVRLLDPFGVEDDSLESPNDVAGVGEPLLGCRVDVDRVCPGGDIGQVLPVAGVDLHHVVDARVVGVLDFGQAEVGPLARVPRHDVVDDRAAVPIRGAAHVAELFLGTERGVDPGAYPVEVAVDAWRLLPAREPTGQLYRAGVYRLDADCSERLPHLFVGHRVKE